MHDISASRGGRHARGAALAKVHIAKKELGLEDETYRDILERVTGQRSAARLEDRQLGAVLSELRRLGWKPRGRKPRPKNPMLRKIHALWGILADHGHVRSREEQAINSYIKRMTGIERPEWLTTADCSRVIESLKGWLARVGLEDELL